MSNTAGETRHGEDRHPGDVRRIVEEPSGNQAGLAVMREYDPGPNETKYTVEQLWPDGTAEPVYVGDDAEALHLIQVLAEVVRREQC